MLEKYGEEVTLQFVQKQKAYKEKKKIMIVSIAKKRIVFYK